jgi:hypothetical protein
MCRSGIFVIAFSFVSVITLVVASDRTVTVVSSTETIVIFRAVVPSLLTTGMSSLSRIARV